MISPSNLGHWSTMSQTCQSIKPPRALLFVLAALVSFFAAVWGAVTLATTQGDGPHVQPRTRSRLTTVRTSTPRARRADSWKPRGDRPSLGCHAFSKRSSVVDVKRSSGRSTVLGNDGWFTESGKC